MRVAFILVAAGAGQRLGSPVPKAFVDLTGKSLLLRSLEALQAEPRVSACAVVVPAELRHEAESQVQAIRRPGLVLDIVAGGAERQDSVAAGLESLSECDVVVIHDAARALVQPALVSACIDAAAQHGAATAAIPVTDTVKEIDSEGAVVRTLDRSRLCLVQTPQAFRREIIVAAHERARREGLRATDDAALVEACGGVVWTVAGDPTNLKVTTPADLDWARWLLAGGPR